MSLWRMRNESYEGTHEDDVSTLEGPLQVGAVVRVGPNDVDALGLEVLGRRLGGFSRDGSQLVGSVGSKEVRDDGPALGRGERRM